MSEESKKVSLYKKIQLVANEIKNIEKDMTVGSGNYAYKAVSDLQVTLAVKEAEKKHGIVSIPVSQELINSEIVKTVNSKNEERITYVDNIKMTIKIVDLETGDFELIESFGKGIDSGDKGFGKASTYARKYGLLNAYKIATGEDPDAEKSQEQTAPKSVSEKRKLIENYLNDNVDLLNQTLSHFNVSKLGELTEANISTMYGTYKKRGVI